MQRSKLAINGGPKVREKPLPFRKLFGADELKAVNEVFEDSWQEGWDFNFQGKYEKLYTDSFCEFQGGGFADAVSSGTAAIYVALRALDIAPGSDVVVSPVTDPGSVAPVIIQGLNVVVADSSPNSFNMGRDEFVEALTPNTRAAIVTHLGGHPVDIEPIVEIAAEKGIRILEDCSQAHGALYKGKRVGCFGDVAAFSTAYAKNHATGGCGGLVYTRNEDYYWMVRAAADRGKPFQNADFDPKAPSEFKFPGLNFNLDELSCAIGLSTLSRLQETNEKRYEIANKIDASLLERSKVVSPCETLSSCFPALFFHTVRVANDKLRVMKREFAQAVAAEGIWLNPHYDYVVSEWRWLQPYLKSGVTTPNAKEMRDSTFNILFNERFVDSDVADIVSSIIKVEDVFRKG